MKYVWLVLCCWLLTACSTQPSIPVYPTIDSTISLDDARLETVVAAFWTTDSATDVRAWYLDAMPKAGWVDVSSNRDSHYLGFHAKNNPNTYMTIRIKEQGLTMVIIGERVPVNF